MSEQESGQVSEQEKEAIKELIDSSNLSLIGDGTMIVKNTTIATTLNYIEKLQKELEEKTTILMAGAEKVKQLEKKITELEKTIDLIIDDFQAENYFVGMTNKEVREYYKKRKELKE